MSQPKLHRTNHVGSFLRPPSIHEARLKHLEGKITDQELRKVEDLEIENLVKEMRKRGIKTISDGEFRREYFHLDFLKHVGGVTVSENTLPQEDKLKGAPPKLSVTGKLEWIRPIQLDDFLFLKSIAQPDEVIKVAIPSPTMIHFRGGRASISIESYPDLDEFFKDLAKVYRDEIRSLVDAGCTFIQLDDTNLAYLTDEKMRRAAEERGEDLNKLPSQYAELINDALSEVPPHVTIGIHLCRGNFRSTFFASGGYEPIAQVLFQVLKPRVYFLEFDDSRSGSFEPLKYLPNLPDDKVVILGLVSSKFAKLENEDELTRRIEEASKWAKGGKARLGLSCQCGFASTIHGNEITAEDQWKKMELVRSVCARVWGEDEA